MALETKTAREANNRPSGWILVTGAGGFVGQHCVSSLHKAGYSVLALQRSAKPSDYIPENDSNRFHRILSDLNDEFNCPHPVRAIVHLAAQVVHPDVTAADFAGRNIATTLSVTSLAQRLGVELLVFHSSISIYGTVHQREISEETPATSPAPYGASKYLGELVAQEMGTKMMVVAPRTPGIIGLGGNPNFITDMVKNATEGAPITLRNPDAGFNHVLHVDDYCRFVMMLLEQEKHTLGFDAINLACREPITIRETADLVLKKTQSTSPIETLEAGGQVPTLNVTKAEAAYGFRTMTVSEAVVRYCDQYAHGPEQNSH